MRWLSWISKIAIECRHCENCTLWSWTTFWRSQIWKVTISEMVRNSAKMHVKTFVDFVICHRMETLQKLILTYFWRSTIWNVKICETKLAQNCMDDFYRFWYLPSNGIIAKTLLCDLGLLFEGKKFKTLISLKQSEIVQKCIKMHGMTFVDLKTLQKLYSLTLIYFFKVTGLKLNVNISEMVRASAKFHPTSLIDFDIFYQNSSLRILYYVTLTYFLKFKNLKR